MNAKVTPYGDIVLEPTSDSDFYILKLMADNGVRFASCACQDMVVQSVVITVGRTEEP